MKTIATIEARMASSRLPGKSIAPVMGKSILEHAVANLAGARCSVSSALEAARDLEIVERIRLSAARDGATLPVIPAEGLKEPA